MPVTLDMFEYANNAAIQAAWVTSDEYSNEDPTSDMLSSNDVYLYSDYTVFVDNNTGSAAWHTDDSTPGAYVAVDLGSGNDKAYIKARIYADQPSYSGNYSVQYSDNGADWDDAATNFIPSSAGWNEKTWSDVGSHRYWRFYLTNTPGGGPAIYEIEFYAQVLQCYSESSIKQQGNYSLKGVAKQTNSLNQTLTRTVDPTIDLSGLPVWYLYIYSSRTGSNIKVGIHDSGGVTTEVTPNITSAGAWQAVELDISAVADADKDAIDQIIITIVNADSNNTFYLDDMYSGLIVVSRERNIVYDSILELSKTRNIVYDSVLELSKTRNIVYDSVLELSKERNILYDSVLELSKTRDIVYDSVLELSKERDIVYDLVLELSKERNIRYDSVLEVSKERNILYDLFELIQRLEAPTGVWVKQDKPSGVAVKQDRPTGTWIKQDKPS